MAEPTKRKGAKKRKKGKRTAAIKSSAKRKTGGYKGNPNLDPVTHQFVPGNQASKGRGRPKGSVSITKRLRQLIGQAVKDGSFRKVADVLAEQIIRQAVKGNFPFMNLLLERTDGKVPDVVEARYDHNWEFIPDEEIEESEEVDGADSSGEA